MANKNITQLVGTGLTRLSYCNLWKPRAADKNSDPKYGCMLLIPKTDKKTKAAIDAAVDVVFKGNPSYFKNYDLEDVHPLRDGDGKSKKGKKYDDVCKGFWVLNCASKNQPKIIGKDSEEITDPDEVYSGCWAKVGLCFYPYDANGNIGIAAGLNLVKKMKDDEKLAGNAKEEDYWDSKDDEDDEI